MGHRHRADKYYTTDLVITERTHNGTDEEWKMIKYFLSLRI